MGALILENLHSINKEDLPGKLGFS